MRLARILPTLLTLALCSCQPASDSGVTASVTPNSETRSYKLNLTAGPNPTGKVVNAMIINEETRPVALAQADSSMNTGWSAVFVVNGQEYRWRPPTGEKRLPTSQDFVVIQPGDEFEFGFPLENFFHQPEQGEELSLEEQKGEVEARISYEVDEFTKRRWPTPTPSATSDPDPILIEKLEVTNTFTLPHSKHDAKQDDGEGPPPGIGGGPPRPDGGPATPHPSVSPSP